MEKHTVSASLTDNTKYMNRALPVKKSFDIIERNLIIGGQNSAFYARGCNFLFYKLHPICGS